MHRLQENIIPKNMYFAWFGSLVKEDHLKAIHEWQLANPEYQAYLFVDDRFLDETKRQSEVSIKVKPFSIFKIDPSVQAFIATVTNESNPFIVPNHGASSDFYRFYILKKGGWWLEFDVVPISLDKITIDPMLKFIVNAARKDNTITALSPSVIGVSANNLLIDVAVLLAKSMASEFNRPHIAQLIAGREGISRMDATMFSSGYILRSALGHLSHNNLPLIYIDETKDNTIPDVRLFDRASYPFKEENSKSWVVSKSEKSAEVFKTLPGIMISRNIKKHPAYRHLLNGILLARATVDQQTPSFVLSSQESNAVASASALVQSLDTIGRAAFDCASRLMEPFAEWLCDAAEQLVKQCPNSFPPNHFNCLNRTNYPVFFHQSNITASQTGLPSQTPMLLGR